MSQERNLSRSQPKAVPGSSPHRGGSPGPETSSRDVSTARLASPVPSSLGGGLPVRQIPVPSQVSPGTQTPLAGAVEDGQGTGPGRSALAAALEGHYGRSPPRFGTPPARPLSPAAAGVQMKAKEQEVYGSFRSTSGLAGAAGASSIGPYEDHEIVKRHLVQPSNEDLRRTGRSSFSKHNTSSQRNMREASVSDAPDLDEFSSLQLQGGDITRGVYRWAEAAETKNKRSKSFHMPRPEPESETTDIQNIKVPGGFRRDHLRRAAASPSPSGNYGSTSHDTESGNLSRRPQPVLTNNFLEFLTLYGHFAGEELEDDDDVESDDYFQSESYDRESDDEGGAGEGSALLTPRTPGGRRRPKKPRSTQGQNTQMGAALLLLKSFVGTGVLFLPRAYLNGGMLFSNVVLLGVAILSYYCFILLVNTRLRVEASFGDMGGILYGKGMRALILTSIVLSQIGFVAAYIVFTSENLQAFIVAVSQCKTWIDIKWMVLMQLVIFLPLSLIRDISKLGFTALVADAFILLGLLYLYYYDIRTIAVNHGPADIVPFNPRDWTLFIGTAIFTFEGIGLIIPIQESMKNPAKFPPVLAGVMIIITAIFVTMGAISYAAFGSATKTVVLLNLPQDDKFVNAVQLLYSLAILLSTPLQLFPAIRIMENELFTRSGKNNPFIKWEKNIFRFCLVMVCAAIAWGGAGDLDKFVALVGSFACVPLVYIYPVSVKSNSITSVLTPHSPYYISELSPELESKKLRILYYASSARLSWLILHALLSSHGQDLRRALNAPDIVMSEVSESASGLGC